MAAVQMYCTYLANECLLQPTNLVRTEVHLCASALDQPGHGTVRDLVWDQQSHLLPEKGQTLNKRRCFATLLAG